MRQDQKEQGTAASGYEEKGPYHCKDCMHKVHANVPICIHPAVLNDPVLITDRCWTDSPSTRNRGVFIDLEKGCCKYVHVPD